MAALDCSAYDVLTFDCYGTLIDFEGGMLGALRAASPVLAAQDDDALLEAFARAETDAELPPYRSYREVLTLAAHGVARSFGTELDDATASAVPESIRDWMAFPDSVEALRRLSERFRLAVITNCDDDLFAWSDERLGRPFTWQITAQRSGAYKPGLASFELAFATIDVPRERILHVAQSRFHDHEPAARLGLDSVWIDRRHDRPGPGGTLPADATGLARFESMAAFADAALASPRRA